LLALIEHARIAVCTNVVTNAIRMRKTRTDSTAAERYDRWEGKARQAGKRRLAVWLPAEAFARLQALAQTHGMTLAQTVAKVALEHGQALPQESRAKHTAARARRVGTNVDTNGAKSVSANGAGISPEARDLVLAWRAEGASWAECARRLDERSILPPRGGSWLQGRGQTNLNRYFTR